MFLTESNVVLLWKTEANEPESFFECVLQNLLVYLFDLRERLGFLMHTVRLHQNVEVRITLFYHPTDSTNGTRCVCVCDSLGNEHW